MHPNKTFRVDDSAKLLGFLRARGFGTLSAVTDAGLQGASVPFVVDADINRLRFHLSRGNTLVPTLASGADVFLSVMGEDAYISPDWYGVENQVPTWNYVTVHVKGHCSALPDDDLPSVLDDLSAEFETRLAPKPPWTRAKMDEAILERMQRSIQPFAISIASMDGTWKLSQNKPIANIQGAIEGLEGRDDVSSTAMATLMKQAAGASS